MLKNIYLSFLLLGFVLCMRANEPYMLADKDIGNLSVLEEIKSLHIKKTNDDLIVKLEITKNSPLVDKGVFAIDSSHWLWNYIDGLEVFDPLGLIK